MPRFRTKTPHRPRKSAKTAKQSENGLIKALLTRDEWLRLAAQGSELGLWHWNEITKSVFWDLKTREIFGVSPDGAVTLKTFYRVLHPEDRARVIENWRYQLENALPFEIEYRIKRPDGHIRWISARGSGYHDKAGKPQYMIGVIFDVTEERFAEKERVELSGRLINAQEQERSRLARELHDDFGQRLSLAAFEADRLAETTKDSHPEISEHVRELYSSLSRLISDLHLISHRLYSAKLESLGLVPSLRSACEDFAKQHATRVDFLDKNVPKSLFPDTALCLFRIVQEGLHNIASHAKASKVTVRITGSAETISLILGDNGIGFQPSRSPSTGIGLQSMKERVRMLGGTLQVLSRPGRGTRIVATLPL